MKKLFLTLMFSLIGSLAFSEGLPTLVGSCQLCLSGEDISFIGYKYINNKEYLLALHSYLNRGEVHYFPCSVSNGSIFCDVGPFALPGDWLAQAVRMDTGKVVAQTGFHVTN